LQNGISTCALRSSTLRYNSLVPIYTHNFITRMPREEQKGPFSGRRSSSSLLWRAQRPVLRTTEQLNGSRCSYFNFISMPLQRFALSLYSSLPTNAKLQSGRCHCRLFPSQRRVDFPVKCESKAEDACASTAGTCLCTT